MTHTFSTHANEQRGFGEVSPRTKNEPTDGDDHDGEEEQQSSAPVPLHDTHGTKYGYPNFGMERHTISPDLGDESPELREEPSFILNGLLDLGLRGDPAVSNMNPPTCG